MSIEEFWDIYLNNDITTISDSVIDFFNQKLPTEIYEDYDFGTVITEFTGHHDTLNKYEEIEKLGEVLKDKQPKFYKELGEYINEDLIRYYCFTKNHEKLKIQVHDAINKIDYSFYKLKKSVKHLLYNEYNDEVKEIITSDYVTKNELITPFVDNEFRIFNYYFELERLYLNKDDHFTFDINSFLDKKDQFGVPLNEEYCKHIELGLFNKSENVMSELLKEFPYDRSYIMLSLEMKFLQYMHKRNCSFPLAGEIWHILYVYFDERNANNWQNYLKIEKQSFMKVINGLSNFFDKNTTNEALAIWGSSYFLDFIFEHKIILESNYQSQKEIIERIKNKFKKTYSYELWKFSFLHNWTPPEIENLDIWIKEKEEFKSSICLEIDKEEFNKLKLDKLFGNSFYNNIKDKPIEKKKKMGRNEKVNVRYLDGTIKKEIKYKLVMNDISNGDCEII